LISAEMAEDKDVVPVVVGLTRCLRGVIILVVIRCCLDDRINECVITTGRFRLGMFMSSCRVIHIVCKKASRARYASHCDGGGIM
jgi:hypothetical protein